MAVKAKRDHYTEITNTLVSAIESALAENTKLPWHKPWKSAGAMRNGVSNRQYRGINTLILAMTPFNDPRWFTFNQIKKIGGNVKGQKSTCILRPVVINKKDENGNKTDDTFMIFKGMPIFNKEQVSGVEFPSLEVKSDNQRNHKAEDVIIDTNAKINHGGDRACYSPDLDLINLPSFDSFESADHYYSTAFHELGHWTGHESRLDRPLNEGRFGNEAYAFEELVAELTASFVCRDLAIDTMQRDDHAAYLKSWLKVLQNDTKAIFRASSLAETATKEIIGQHAEDTELVKELVAE